MRGSSAPLASQWGERSLRGPGGSHWAPVWMEGGENRMGSTKAGAHTPSVPAAAFIRCQWREVAEIQRWRLERKTTF